MEVTKGEVHHLGPNSEAGNFTPPKKKHPKKTELLIFLLTFVIKLLHHLRHQVLVEGLPPLDDVHVKAVVNLLEL